jgi:uncharacterized protein (DUF1015 family)
MANVLPFKAFLYNKKLRGEIKNLVSPPYDVISPKQQAELKARHENNSVKLCLVEDAQDSNRYQKMKALYQDWKEKSVLTQNESPSFYLIEDTFEAAGEKKTRIGFVGLLQTCEIEDKVVLPHEHTLKGPKVDRLALLKTMGAEFSQIFLSYKDPQLTVENIYEKKKNATPDFEIEDDLNIHRRMWLISDSAETAAMTKMFQDKELLIADGHHRYETAIAFKNEDGTERSKYVQCYFMNLDSPGFSIQPIHRLFSLPENMSHEDFKAKLSESFDLSEYSEELSFQELEKNKSDDEINFICSMGDKNYLLKRKKKSPDDAEIFSLQHDIFEKLLGWDISKLSKGVIRFEHTNEEYKDTLKSLPRGVGFYLPATDLNLVMKLAKEGKRMPQKSTFFYPKLASGLVIYELGNA